MANKSRVEFINNREQVLERMNQNAAAATMAAGVEAVGLIVRQMQSGYGRPIRQTGDLMRDVNFEVVDARTVNVGNGLDYSLFVHEGTSHMAKRPYINDALNNESGKEAVQKAYAAQLKKGFE